MDLCRRYMGNAIHEVVVHGSQISYGKTFFTIDGNSVKRWVKMGTNPYDLEVEAYQALYSYKGELHLYETPDPSNKECHYGDKNLQINDQFSYTSYGQIKRWRIKIIQAKALGNELLYKK